MLLWSCLRSLEHFALLDYLFLAINFKIYPKEEYRVSRATDSTTQDPVNHHRSCRLLRSPGKRTSPLSDWTGLSLWDVVARASGTSLSLPSCLSLSVVANRHPPPQRRVKPEGRTRMERLDIRPSMEIKVVPEKRSKRRGQKRTEAQRLEL